MSIKKLEKNDQDPEVSTEESREFEELLSQSMDQHSKKLNRGDKISAEVLAVGNEFVVVSTGTQFDGFVPVEQLSSSEGRVNVSVGDHLDLFVTHVKGSQVHLSPSATGQKIADGIEEAFKNSLTIEGRVESANKGGFEIQLAGAGKARAFCPFAQMDQKRVEDPEPYLGKRYEFLVTQYEDSGRNIVVSRRKVLELAQAATLSDLLSSSSSGQRVLSGRVSRIESYGAFVEISPGVDGMVHVSEMSWSRVNHPSDLLEIDQTVSVQILKVEEQENGRQKISLSMKRVKGDPWDALSERLQVGRIVAGKVTRCMPFGAFVELSPGVEGLIPISQLSSSRRVNRVEDVVHEGQELSVKVKQIDRDSKRISLSLKDALDEEASLTEAEDMRHFRKMQNEKQKNSPPGDFAAKLQAALSKKGKKV